MLPPDAPFVSVLVPARNEAHNIERCVRSLLAQHYPSFEVLVLDDHSEDGTGERVRRLQREHPGAARLRLLHGAPLPDGWGGKNWACQQLAEAADPRSRFLLFTDADTEHHPAALRRTVAEAARDSLALLSLMPQQRVESWAERAVVPLLPLQILGYLPLLAAERLPFPTLAAANGQYLLFERAAYERCGGHAAFPLGLAEDVLLAQRVKAHGGRVRLANGAGLVRCRMYRSAGEVLAGFRRSFGAGFRLGPWISAWMLLFNGLAYLLPFLRAPVSRRARHSAALVLALRITLALPTQTPRHAALLHPLGIALLLWSQLLAAHDAFVGGESEWKGRRYPHRVGRETRP